MPITHSTTVAVADDGTSPVGTDEWNAGHTISLDSTLNFVIDGGGTAIATGIHGDLVIDFACTILSWKIVADQTGSIVVDVWSDTYNNFPPLDADAMPGAGNEPTITAAAKAYGNATGVWTKTAIAAGDVLRFNVDSCTTITRVTIALKVSRTA